MNVFEITLKNWSIFRIKESPFYTGDNLVGRIEINTDLEDGWQLKLDIRRKGKSNFIDLTRKNNLYYVDLTKEILSFSGTVTAQIRGINGDKVAHSNQFEISVQQAINAVDSLTPAVPS